MSCHHLIMAPAVFVQCVMFVCWFLRGGASLLLTSPALHARSIFLILPADVPLPHSSILPIKDQMQRFPLFKIYSRPRPDVRKGLHPLATGPESGTSATFTNFCTRSSRTLRFPQGRVRKPAALPSQAAFLSTVDAH